MRLLLDQGLPRSAAEILRRAGYDVVHAGERGLASATDEEILTAAKGEGRTVVTLDAEQDQEMPCFQPLQRVGTF